MRSTASYSNDFLSSGHAYSVTRVKAMKALLFKKEDYDKMLKMSLPEINRLLQENQYKKEIDFFASSSQGLMLTEMAITRNLENVFSKILGFSVQSSKGQISLFLKKYDIFNITTILKGFRIKVDKKELKDNLIAAGSLKREFLEKIINESNSFEDAVTAFKGTSYFKVISKNQENVAQMEDVLFKDYFEELLANGDADLHNFALKQIKAYNSRQLIRKEKNEIKPIQIAGIKDSYIIPEPFKGKEEIYLLRQVLSENLKLLHIFKSSVGVLLAYFLAKEIEVRNLRFMAVGKNSNLNEEMIKENLVIA